jgi:hypothetical protein
LKRRKERSLEYGTINEKVFLRSLGSWGRRPVGEEDAGLKLLRRYRNAMRLRKVWNGIDRKEIEKFVDVLLCMKAGRP